MDPDVFVELTDAEETEAWDAIVRTFSFDRAAPRLGAPHEIREPPSCDVVLSPHLAHSLPEDFASRKLALAAQNELLARVIQRALRASEWLLSLDWQHPCYRVRLHDVPARAWQDYDPLWVLPDHDPRFHLSPDLANGTFSGCEERFYLFGDELRDAARAEGLHEQMPVVHRPRW